MDYGKLAYMKAEDIERRLDGADKKETRSAKAVFKPRVRLTEKGYDLTEISGDGTITAVVRAEVRAGNAYRGVLKLRAGTLGLSDCALNLAAGETHVCVMLAALDCAGGVPLSIAAEEGVTLTALELAVMGSGAKVYRRAGDFAADGSCVLVSEDERLRAYSAGAGELSAGKVVGFGHRADLIAAGEGYFVAYADNTDNLFGCALDGGLNVTGVRYLGRGADGIAVSDDGGRAAIALLRGGRVTIRYVDFDLKGVSMETETEIEGVERIKFVKNAPVPMLMTESGGTCVMRTAEREPRGRENVSLRFVCEITEIPK